jgi:hypothetical protein
MDRPQTAAVASFSRFLGLYTSIFLCNQFFIQKMPVFGKNICKSRRFLVTLPLTDGAVTVIVLSMYDLS